MDNAYEAVRQIAAQLVVSEHQQQYRSMPRSTLEYRSSSTCGTGVGPSSRPVTSTRPKSRPASQQTFAPQFDSAPLHRTSSGGSRQQQLQSSMQSMDLQGVASSRPYSRLQHMQPVQQAHSEQQQWPPRPVSRLGNYPEPQPQDRITNTIDGSIKTPSSTMIHNNNVNCCSGCNGDIAENRATIHTLGPGDTLQCQQPEQGFAAQQQQQARCANPLFCSNNHAALLASSSRAGTANPYSRVSSAAGYIKAVTSFESSPQCSPRRASLTTATQSYAAVAAGADYASQSRPVSSSNHRGFSSTGRVLNSSPHIASPRVPMRAASNATQPSHIVPSKAVPAAMRPGSSIPLGTLSHQQQQQQERNYKQLPAGALSQDPVGPPLAAHVKSPSRQQDRRSSKGNSRPSTAAGGSTAAAVASGSSCIDSRSANGRQQLRPNSSAASATAASALYSPRIMQRSGNSSRRPGSAAQRQQQQKQGYGEAAGPLLSDYFRPPSAAAPGSVGLFGLPGLEPPGGRASAVPCVRVPSVHASWDATAAGLSSDSSIGQQGSGTQLVAGNSDGQVSAADMGPGVAKTTQQQQQALVAADKPHESTHDSNTAATGAGKGSTTAVTGNCNEQLACHPVQQPDSSQGAMLNDQQQQQPQQQAPGLDGDADGRPQLLLWSAAHEIDGRPVTRNGERVRPPTRGVTSA